MTIDELRSAAAIVRDATEDGENTATRIGQLFLDVINAMGSLTGTSIKGYQIIDGVEDLPADPNPSEQMVGYLLDTTLYVYVGTGGDTLGGKYQSVQLQGPAGEDGIDLIDPEETEAAADNTLSQTYVNVDGATTSSGTATTTVGYYPISGDIVSVTIGKTANSATVAVSLAKSATQTTGLVAASSKKGNNDAYSLEFIIDPAEYSHVVVCYNNSESVSVKSHFGQVDYSVVKRNAAGVSGVAALTKTSKIINYTTGEEQSGVAEWGASDYIDVPASARYYIFKSTVGSSSSGYGGFAFYNSSKAYISGVKNVGRVLYGAIPANAAYVRWSGNTSDTASLSIVNLETLSATIAELENSVAGKVDASVIGRSVSRAYTHNDCTVKGRFIYRSDGSIASNTSFDCSDFLPVFGTSLTLTASWTGTNAGIAFYDSSRAFISGIAISSQQGTSYAIPSTAKFIRLSNKVGETISVAFSASGIDGFNIAVDGLLTPPAKKKHILVLGNSFSEDTCTYLNNICTNLGVDDVVVQYIYQGGANLQYWCEHMSSTYVLVRACGSDADAFGSGVLTSILSQPWDAVVLQQASADSADYTSYKPYVSIMLEAIKRLCPNKGVSVKFHMTWPWTTDSDITGDSEMYAGIIAACKSLKEDYGHIIDTVIPTGTALQNVRGTTLNTSGAKGFTYDKHHLSHGVGEYVAGCAFYTAVIAPLSGVDIYGDTTVVDLSSSTETSEVSVTSENRPTCHKCAVYAVLHPWGLTDIDNL